MCSGADINAVLSLRCAERSQATEQRYNKLKEKHTELVASHAELLRKVQTDFRPVRRCLMLHLAVCGNTKCVNVLTECRHCEDAYSDPADPGRGGEDQTAAVVWDRSNKTGGRHEGWWSDGLLLKNGWMHVNNIVWLCLIVYYCFDVPAAGRAEVWNGETEERAGGEDGRSDAYQGDFADQREGECTPGMLNAATTFMMFHHHLIFRPLISHLPPLAALIALFSLF